MTFAEQAQHQFFVYRVEITRGLIRQNDFRIIDERPGNADALLLAARELRRQVIGPVTQTHAGKRVNRFFLVGHAVEVLRQHHVLNRRQKRNKVKLLKDESNLFCSHAVQLAGGNARDTLPVKPDFTGRGPVEAANQIHQRRFARPRRPHNREPFALCDVQRDVIQRMNRAPLTLFAILIARSLGGVEFGDVFDLNHFTLPSRWPPAAPAATMKSAEWTKAASLPCYQPAQTAGQRNVAPRERGS